MTKPPGIQMNVTALIKILFSADITLFNIVYAGSLLAFNNRLYRLLQIVWCIYFKCFNIKKKKKSNNCKWLLGYLLNNQSQILMMLLSLIYMQPIFVIFVIQVNKHCVPSK